MENKEIKNISEFFSKEHPELSPQQKWDLVFEGWINKIDEKKLMPNLFELKTWFEALEEFFSSTYLEELVFKYQTTNSRDYEFYFSSFNQVVNKIIGHLKDLDFEKDRYLLNFEEFIVEKIFEDFATTTKAFPYLKDIYSPSSWFYSLRIFLQNLKTLAFELTKNNTVSQKAFFSLRKLYRKELTSNSIIISLLKGNFIPKMDKIYQQDICDIITDREEKKLKREIGIFFIFAFRVMKLNNFVELNLNISRNINLIIPLVLLLKKKIENIFSFYESMLQKSLEAHFNKAKDLKKIAKIINDFRLEYQKIFEGEFPYFFDTDNEKVNRRKLLKNIVIISDMAIQDLIESVAKLFKPEISGNNIFENYTSRAEKASEVKQKLVKLHSKINNYLTSKGDITPSDIFFDINQFIETDLNYLLFKDWNEFLNFYNKLVVTDFSPEFRANLTSFHSFITKVLKEMVDNKSS
jgi:flagellin-specific chaperone FliS